MTIAEVISLESDQLKFISFYFKSSPDVREMIGEKKEQTQTGNNSYELKQHVCCICETAEMAVWLKKHSSTEIAHLWKKPRSTTKKIPSQNGFMLLTIPNLYRVRVVLCIPPGTCMWLCVCLCVLKELLWKLQMESLNLWFNLKRCQTGHSLQKAKESH